MSELHFIRPLWLLLLMPLLTACYLLIKNRPKQALAKIIAPHLLAYFSTGQGQRSRLSPTAVLLAFLVLLVVIAAGPSWQPEPNTQAVDSTPTTIVVDLSSTMAANDIAPNRLENAKLKLLQLLALKQNGPVGVWVYAGSSHLLLPPTVDREVLSLYLSSLSTGLVPRAGKDLAALLARPELQPEVVAGSLLIVSDSLDGANMRALADFNRQPNSQVLFWKFGFEPRLSTSAVKTLQMTGDDSDVQQVVRWLNSYSYFDPADETIQWQEAGYWLVFVAIALALLWFRRGWSVDWRLGSALLLPLVMLLSAAAPAPAMAQPNGDRKQCGHLLMNVLLSPDQQGQWYYQRGNYRCAALLFEDRQWKAQALLKSGQWQWALTLMNKMPESAQRSLNIGLAYANLQRFRSAETWFQHSLEQQPNSQAAQQNLAVLAEVFELMSLRADGQGTAGEDMTADHVLSLQEDMEVEQSEDIEEVINSADLIADEHLTKIWLEQVKSRPEVFLRNKFSLQLQRQSGAQQGADNE
ncbi:hypothetical protein SIN8267_01208 [Sinobacterium norvegicum]|uniref:VWFA domain-containing protein n=1 Tax=Sinobacterium norvegicum TaxID=1641715 RepID=A0ABM9AD35_9GAMM|nr:VWA domain-containing protein [Sinobacterium norvegicum]CAH0991107.1 hypothetical protein SIN8267_01208 [Sinobacterium norvegicum]